MKTKLRSIIDDHTTYWGCVFDYFIQSIIALSLVAFALSTLPNNSNLVQAILYWVEVVSVAIFSVEYILRIYVAEKRSKYIFSFFGIIDLFAILPFYLTSVVNLTPLRIFRIFRVFRALKLIRYNKAMARFAVAASLVKEEVVLFLIVTGIFLFLASAGIYYFENPAQPAVFSSIFSSAWWAIVTLTTVGYGDVYPVTTGGRMFTFLILMVGVGIVTVPAGLTASALTKARELEEEEKQQVSEDGDLSSQRP